MTGKKKNEEAKLEYQWHDFVGNIGAVMILIAYFMLQLNKVDNKSLSFNSLNIVGALLIMFSLYYNFNLSSFIIEVFWLLISFIGVFNYFTGKKKNID